MTDTDRRTEPALDAEDWDYFLSGGIRKHTLQDAVECAERGRRDLTPRSLAALALHGERYGFTWEDVDAIRAVANGWTMDAENHDTMPGLTAHERAIRDRALSAADRLAALLPPR